MNSHKLRLVRLRAEGFRGICDPLDIDFHQQTTVLSAPNGSGKTSILGAIEWALFGELQYQPKENATNDELVNIRHRTQVATVTIDLANDDGIVSITRSKKAGKRAAEAIVQLPNGEEYVGAEANTALFRVLGLTFDDFYRAVYLHQESIRGLLTDDPRVRNEALDRLFGVEKLRDMLKALSGSTKPVRDALDKLEKSKSTAVARLTGAVGQVEEQRQRALNDAEKKGLSQTDLTFDTIIALAEQVMDGLAKLASATEAVIKEQSEPEGTDGVDSFSRRVTEAIKVIRQTATNAAIAANTTKVIADVDGALTSLRRVSALLDGVGKSWTELQETYGDPNTLDEQKVKAQAAVQRSRDTQEKLGISERIVRDTLIYLQASLDENNCPACGQAIERDELIGRLEGHLTGDIRSEMEAARTAQSEQQNRIDELDTAITKRDRLLTDSRQYSEQIAEARVAARAFLPSDVADDDLQDALDAQKDKLFQQASTVDADRDKREEEIEAIQAVMARLKDIARFLELDDNYQEASSRLGNPDEESSIAEQQIESLSRLEGGIRTIADVVTAEASTRARDAVESAQVDIAKLYKELCNHPYFDDIQISVESQLLSGIERNNYFIRTQSSADNRQTLASSRLSTAQMNCVALSVYLALATQLQHNLGFVILDDPSQNLDTEHKQALVAILSRLAPQLQVLVGTQDSELDDLIGTSAAKDSFHRRCLTWSPLTGSAVVAEDG
ncbi:MAG: AAA family ATPase [Acidimicrobiales bacterium]